VTDDEARALVDDPALRGSCSAVDVAEGFLERIERAQSRLNAFITVTPELALVAAREVDAARARGTPLPLDGMPVAVKDNVDVAGAPSTAGSRLYAERVAERDSPVVTCLRAAGAVIVGKTNLHELAFGATCLNEAFGTVVNPWDATRIPGGSSGGSGVAVAADLCVGAIGTDTGGSIRLPAAFCGVAGLRPTFGTVSTDGVLPVARSLDTVGPLARSAADLVSLYAVLADVPAVDPGPVAGLRVGLPTSFFFDAVDSEVERRVTEAAGVVQSLGATVGAVDLPGAAAASEACGILIRSEALGVHQRDLAERPELFENGTRRRLALARGVTAGDLARVRRLATDWRECLRLAFEQVDVVLTPTTPAPAPASGGADTIATTAAVVPFTHAFSLALVPSVSLPCGLTSDGLPVGVQLAAPDRSELLLLRVAAALQGVTDWHLRRPPGINYKPASIRTTS
jgi:aspartyl-tRNA(Asn)/glutamyl-tRNA(Gln) amidotransferase subunit A